MLIEAVEKRFGDIDDIPEGWQLEFLADSGEAYRAVDTNRIAGQMGLQLFHSPIYSQQINGQLKDRQMMLLRATLNSAGLALAVTVESARIGL